MRGLLAASVFVATSTVSATTAWADQETGSIKYSFRTLLVPELTDGRSLVVKTNKAWFSGKAVPVRAVTISTPVSIDGTRIVLPAGTVYSVADSAYFVVCEQKIKYSSNGGMGAHPICLIDLDRDGNLDSWFRSSVGLIWSSYSGHIQRDDFGSISPVSAQELSGSQIRALEAWSTFETRYVSGRLTYCMPSNRDICLVQAPKIKPSANDQTVEFMGGLYSYRKIEGGMLAIEILRDPTGAIY